DRRARAVIVCRELPPRLDLLLSRTERQSDRAVPEDSRVGSELVPGASLSGSCLRSEGNVSRSNRGVSNGREAFGKSADAGVAGTCLCCIGQDRRSQAGDQRSTAVARPALRLTVHSCCDTRWTRRSGAGVQVARDRGRGARHLVDELESRSSLCEASLSPPIHRHPRPHPPKTLVSHKKHRTQKTHVTFVPL